MVPEGRVYDHHGRKPGSRPAGRQAGRQGAEAVVKSLHLIHKHEAERELKEMTWALETSKPAPSTTPLPKRPHLLILTK